MQEKDGEQDQETFKIIPGKDKAFRITLDLHSNFESTGTVRGDIEGFTIFIGDAAAYPRMKKYGVHIQPGKETFFSLSSTILSADPTIKTIEPFREIF